jgi:HD-GYP domain-containing protein (c-di-GMP phosphodiesterase class II)
MKHLMLEFPVHTLDNRLLLPAGTVLSPEILEEVYFSEGPSPVRTLSLLEHGSIRSDIVGFMGTAPYDVIFGTSGAGVEVMGVMETISLIAPFLAALDHFKKHDFYTYRHILMVFGLSILLAKALLPDFRDRMSEIATSPTHDYGKICVPLPILKKRTPLTKTEYRILKHHSVAGHVLLSYYYRDAGSIFAKVALDHHERRNGSGYPRGISLDDPLVEIIAASDVYDALISPRPYRRSSYSNRSALEELTSMAERKELGWEVVRALVAFNRGKKAGFSQTKVSGEKRGRSPEGNVYGIVVEDGSDREIP